MAFNADGLVAVEALPTPTAGSDYVLACYSTTDTLATVLGSGYFDDEYAKLPAGSIILVTADTGGSPVNATLEVTASSSSGVTVQVDHTGLVQTGSTGDTSHVGAGIIQLEGGSSHTLGAPTPGVDVLIVQKSTDTGGIAVIPVSGVSLDFAGNRKATFDARDEALLLRGVTATQYAVVSNTGSVALAST